MDSTYCPEVGQGVGTLPVKSQVAICFLRITSTDPLERRSPGKSQVAIGFLRITSMDSLERRFPGKSQVAICFLRITSTDPLERRSPGKLQVAIGFLRITNKDTLEKKRYVQPSMTRKKCRTTQFLPGPTPDCFFSCFRRTDQH